MAAATRGGMSPVDPALPSVASPERATRGWHPLRALERLMGADVQPGEWRLVLVFFANLFLLLTAYYILKVIREPLILLGGGAVSRSYARGAQTGGADGGHPPLWP